MSKFKDSLFWTNYTKFEKIANIFDKVEPLTSMRSLSDAVIYWKLFQQYNFSDILEIGVYQGMTAGLMLEASNNPKSYTGIDIDLKLELFNDIWKDFLSLTKFYEQSSLDFEYDKSKTYDFILIDGEHSYQNTITDLRNTKDLLRPDGVLAIDDYYYPGVKKAVEEFRSTTSMVPFLQTDQTEFWHYPSVNRSEFLDNLFNDPIHNFLFLYNINDGQILKVKSLKVFCQNVDLFDQVINQFDI